MDSPPLSNTCLPALAMPTSFQNSKSKLLEQLVNFL
jgi:hypothetical protein